MHCRSVLADSCLCPKQALSGSRLHLILPALGQLTLHTLRLPCHIAVHCNLTSLSTTAAMSNQVRSEDGGCCLQCYG